MRCLKACPHLFDEVLCAAICLHHSGCFDFQPRFQCFLTFSSAGTISRSMLSTERLGIVRIRLIRKNRVCSELLSAPCQLCATKTQFETVSGRTKSENFVSSLLNLDSYLYWRHLWNLYLDVGTICDTRTSCQSTRDLHTILCSRTERVRPQGVHGKHYGNLLTVQGTAKKLKLPHCKLPYQY